MARTEFDRHTDVFRLHILGQLDTAAGSDSALTTLADFARSRKLERVTVKADEAQALAQRVRDLRGFMIDGSDPPFDKNALIKFGTQLYKLIMHGEVRRLLETTRGMVGNRPLPLELLVEDHRIAGWPWEYMYDEEGHRFLCREFHPISRSMFNLFPVETPDEVEVPVRILFVLGANRLDAEANVDGALAKHRGLFDHYASRELVKVDIIDAAHPHKLIEACSAGGYDVFHFYGHAGIDESPQHKEGYLRFDTADLEDYRVYAEDLAEILLGKGFRLAFLNACETGTAARDRDPAHSALANALLAKGIPAVIATQFLMPANSSHPFSAVVYAALAKGVSLVEAMRAGRQSMQWGAKKDDKVKRPDWGIPVLYAAYPELVIFPRAEATRNRRGSGRSRPEEV